MPLSRAMVIAKLVSSRWNFQRRVDVEDHQREGRHRRIEGFASASRAASRPSCPCRRSRASPGSRPRATTSRMMWMLSCSSWRRWLRAYFVMGEVGRPSFHANGVDLVVSRRSGPPGEPDVAPFGAEQRRHSSRPCQSSSPPGPRPAAHRSTAWERLPAWRATAVSAMAPPARDAGRCRAPGTRSGSPRSGQRKHPPVRGSPRRRAHRSRLGPARRSDPDHASRHVCREPECHRRDSAHRNPKLTQRLG